MKKYAAEFLGTFVLVFMGTGAIVTNSATGAVGLVGIALTFGLVVMALISALGDISGAHLNPAVTAGFWLSRRISAVTAIPYMLSQCAGALLASLFLHLLYPQSSVLGETLPAAGVFAHQAFLLEMVLTYFLMFVILSVTAGAKEKGLTAGIAIGAVITLEVFVGGPICGASMNPARSLGPAVVMGHFQHLWIYLVAPVLGAGLAVASCLCIRDKGCCCGEPCA